MTTAEESQVRNRQIVSFEAKLMDEAPISVLKLHELGELGAVHSEIRIRRAQVSRIEALLGDRSGPLWAARGVREEDIRTALRESED